MLAIFDEEGAHGAFWHTFAGWTFPHRPDPRSDLDLGSFGLVKVIEAPSADKDAVVLEPKEALWPPLIGRRAAGEAARWGLDGTEAILTLRAVISNDDFEEYWRFHLAREHQRLYPGTAQGQYTLGA